MVAIGSSEVMFVELKTKIEQRHVTFFGKRYPVQSSNPAPCPNYVFLLLVYGLEHLTCSSPVDTNPGILNATGNLDRSQLIVASHTADSGQEHGKNHILLFHKVSSVDEVVGNV